MKCPKCKKNLTIHRAKELGRNFSFCDNGKCEYLGIKRLVYVNGR